MLQKMVIAASEEPLYSYSTQYEKQDQTRVEVVRKVCRSRGKQWSGEA